MSIIHMDTELAHETARKMAQAVSDMHDLTNMVKSLMYKLQWEGPSRDDYMNRFEKVTNSLILKTEEGLTLSQRLEREVNEWEEADSSLYGSSHREHMDAIKQTTITRQALDHAEQELKRAKAEFEAAADRLGESPGMEDINFIEDALKEIGITNPVLLDALSGFFYVLKRFVDMNVIVTVIEKFKKLSENQSLDVIDHIDLVVTAFKETVGNIWESIKESGRIGDAIGNYIVFNEKAKAYMDAMKKYAEASQAHEAAWDRVIETAPNHE